jgi:putative SOS response-associated peptidase YedK
VRAVCCRYWIEPGEPDLQDIIEKLYRSPLLRRQMTSQASKAGKVVTSGEVRPTDIVPVLAPNGKGEQAVFPMKWGYTGRSLLINARTETAAEKPMFREGWQRHRCIVPSSGYFEWEHLTTSNGKKKTGKKFMIRSGGNRVTWLCGLYRIEDGFPHFVILTREPGESIRFIHDRMPLVLPEGKAQDWIRPGADQDKLLESALTDLEYQDAKIPEIDDADEKGRLD